MPFCYSSKTMNFLKTQELFNVLAHKKLPSFGFVSLLFFIFSLSFFSCKVETSLLASINPTLKQEKALTSKLRPLDQVAFHERFIKAEEKALLTLKAMTLEEKAGQVLMISIGDTNVLSARTKKLLQNLKPGAILFFAFNVQNGPDQVTKLTGNLQAEAKKGALALPFLIAIDHEGGKVLRAKKGYTNLPSPFVLGSKVDAELEIFRLGKISGQELRQSGINWNLAPVVESLTENNKDFLGERSYSEDPKKASLFSNAFIQGLQEENTLACAKHFPGNSNIDPHKGLPVLTASILEYEKEIFPSFKNAIEEKNVAAVMVSHAIVNAIDKNESATVSKKVLSVLKDDLQFKGIALSDDLKMKALNTVMSANTAAVKALSAGTDMLMISGGEDLLEIQKTIVKAVQNGSLQKERLDDAVRRILTQKYLYQIESVWTK